MSRIGVQPIPIPVGVTVTVAGRRVEVKGPKGTLSYEHRAEVSVIVAGDGKSALVSRDADSRPVRAFHGMTRSLVFNMVRGVHEGYEKRLLLEGVGYKFELAKPGELTLHIGLSHPLIVPIPDTVKVEARGQNELIISGCDKQQVGEFAALVRSKKKPEPYLGKGIRYFDEVLRRKAGKSFVGGAG